MGIGEWAEHRGQNGFLAIYEDYDQYVTDLETDFGTTTLIDGGIRHYFPYTSISDNNWGVSFSDLSPFGSVDVYGVGNVGRDNSIVTFQFEEFAMPFNGYVTSGWEGSVTGINLYNSSFFAAAEISQGVKISCTNTGLFGFKFSSGFQSWSFRTYVDIIPYTGVLPTSQDITINSRPSSLNGDYGIIGDDGSIIKVDGNMIVDESSSTVYNPVTNTTLNYTDYAYDYSDRSYNLTLEDGSTMKVTYGDENVTINEGDTVYNIYYIVPEVDQEDDGSGSGGSGDTHSHDYTSEITKLPNCLLSGVRTFTCSCGDSYTKTVPATGHDWQISQQIANTFDPETGEPLTTGYTIYTCATCGEQYKSTDGNAPPNGSTGDDEDGGGLISGLLGAVGDVIGGLIEGALLLATKALEALTGLGDLSRR